MTNNRNPFVVPVVASTIIVSYAVTRLVGITKLPIFNDEAIYIQWAVGVWRGHPFAPLVDGKLLHVWLCSLVVPLAANPLWAARAVSILGGVMAMYACFHIGTRLYSQKAGLVAAALYVICPFTLFYDRIALPDNLLSAFAALTLLWSIALVQDGRWYYAWLLGLSMAAAILCKIPGLLTLPVPILTALLLANSPRARLMRHLALSYCIAVALTTLPIVRIVLTTHQYEKSILGENTAALVTQLAVNIRAIYEWLWFYWTPPVLILAILGLVFATLKLKRETLLLAVASFLPILAFTAVSRILFVRYVLLATVPMLVLAGGITASVADYIGLSGRSQFLLRLDPFSILFLMIVALFAWRVDWLLLTNPAVAPLPAAERYQYIEDWPSGYGVAEAADYLRSMARFTKGGIVVVHHEFTGTTNFGLAVLLMKEKRIAFRKLSIRAGEQITKLVTWSQAKPIFIVLNRPPLGMAPGEQPDITELLKVADLIASYLKPGGRAAIDVYRVKHPL
jgi:hypothetical protein